ncbi:MAG: hypothetical protein ACI4L7_01250 [Christensenellales bacterium]
MENLEKAKKIIEQLENGGHPNLYHDISREDFMKKFNSIDWNSLDEMHFDYEMTKIFALLKESHTRYCSNIPFICIDSINSRFYRINDKFYFYKANESKCYEVLAINNIDIEKISDFIKPIICSESEYFTNKSVADWLGMGYTYKLLGIAKEDNINLKVKKNDEIFEMKVDFLSDKEARRQFVESKKSVIPKGYIGEERYNYTITDDGILILNYKKCKGHEEFRELVNKIIEEYNNGKFSFYILDMTGNGSGSDSVIDPFVDFVIKNGIDGITLIDINTFSSGMISAGKMKKMAKSILMGETSGQIARAYGDYKKYLVEGKMITVSQKLVDITEWTDGKICLEPDITVPLDIEDLEKAVNTKLLYALEYAKQYENNRLGSKRLQKKIAQATTKQSEEEVSRRV